MTSSNILQPQTTATHRLQKHRYIVFKMQGMYWIIGYMFFLSKQAFHLLSLKMSLPNVFKNRFVLSDSGKQITFYNGKRSQEITFIV